MIRFYSADFSGGSEWVKPTRSGLSPPSAFGH
jgi:hypothetical protein